MQLKGKKIIVTGGCGFIGSEVVRQLVERGYAVRVVDNLSKKESTVKAGYEFIKGDLTDKKVAQAVFEGMDVCINLAAKIGGIGYFHKYPATILSENNKIYSATFEAAVKNKLKRMVYISSSMVFESAVNFPSKEDDVRKIPPPISSYGFSKLIGEQYCQAFWDEYGLAYSICRPFNAYGINEFPGEEVGYAHVIPDLIKKILSGQYPLEILGDGKQIRCFTHVSDLADGIISVMESSKAINQDFNIANPCPIAMIDLARLLWKITGQEKPFKVKYVSGFQFDIKKRIPDTAKIEKVLNWKTKVKFEEGLKEVVGWLKNTI
ncbi:MAG: NAD-dependent epimerase/dehydratase family protein [Candidatus Levybacteria bacterium]|nr:NAD-dependent epimerase/dehydratase family protein [Candidatus Levybacteria bacterium]